MNKRYLNPPSLPRPRNYHHVVAVHGGSTIYLAGQVAFDQDRNIIGDDVVTQARQALRNMKTAVEAAGGTLSDIVQITLHVVNYSPDQLDRIAGTLLEFFQPERLPANTLVGVSSLSIKGLLIEITGTAVVEPALDRADR
jgi:enamine deaminase RidA (YjgF/YER057c/UK114 family)